MLENFLKKAIDELESLVLGRLKYNIFSTSHPNSSLRGRLFKFVGQNKIQFLTGPGTREVKKEDLHRGGKKLYFPADMY